MSSLGAQARAAELAAAVVAKRRAQAHQEEEEQAAAAHQQIKAQRNLESKNMAAPPPPPPPSRVSLGAFVGPPKTTKNNGAKKAWRPLHMDDFDEDPNGGTGNEDYDEDDFVRTEPITYTIPTAPRLMRLSMPSSSSSNYLMPPMYRQPSNLSTITTPVDRSRQGTPGPLVPEDLSPTKQEAKFDELRGQNQLDGSLVPSRTGFYPDSSRTENHPPSFDHPSHFELAIQSEKGSFTDLSGHEHTSFITPLQRRPTMSYHEVEPYDTKKAMQRFLAEQAEKSKTDKGKTVLCNPERKGSYYNEDRTDTSYQAPESSRNTVSREADFSTPNTELTQGDFKPRCADLIYIPTQGVYNSKSAVTNQDSGFSVSAQHQVAVHPVNKGKKRSNEAEEDNRLLSDSLPPWFFELQPTMLSEERQLLKERMAKAARDLTVETRREPIVTEYQSDREAEVEKWFNTDGRGQSELRSRAADISVGNATQHRQVSQFRNGGALPENYRPGIDDHYASSLALGEIACNIQTYLVGDQGSADQRAKFNRVKPVPEWCTEKKTMAEAGQGHSYFGTTWGTPPSRVARDPRFRAEVASKSDREGLRKMGGNDDLALLERLRMRRTQAMRRTG